MGKSGETYNCRSNGLGAPPFVLLDDARERGAGAARLYTAPVEIVEARDMADVRAALGRLRGGLAAGLHAAGWIGYEAGLALEAKLARLERPCPADDPPLLWFGLFGGVELLSPDGLAALIPDAAGAWLGAPLPRIPRQDYDRAVAEVLALIAAGDIYQANLSFRADVAVAGHPLALYARMRAASLAGWGGVIHTGRHWLLSCSPELFFTLEQGVLTARPMKGTATRRTDPEADRAAAAALTRDAKQRAENLMIVDLLRNDLSQVSVPGSVAVPALFALETYPTIHTLTSTVTARLQPGRDAVDVIEAIFPCGSVTGAPKIRAMEVIDAVEADRRGPYTGSIGWLAPGGDAAFNVAIRTLMLEQGSNHAVIGLGSAIVADSDAASEWRECLAKGAFLNAGPPPFDLIETMRFDAIEGVLHLDYHLARMRASAEAFGIPFSRHTVRNELQAATFRLRETRRLRLLLSFTGAIAIEAGPVPPAPAAPVDVALRQMPVPVEDIRLRHKTTQRDHYDTARAESGAFEVAFVDADGFLTEGSFTNLFVERDGWLLTPPVRRGLLPGVLRRHLLEEGRAAEVDLVPADLAGGFLIGNALRGLIPARLVAAEDGAGL